MQPTVPRVSPFFPYATRNTKANPSTSSRKNPVKSLPCPPFRLFLPLPSFPLLLTLPFTTTSNLYLIDSMHARCEAVIAADGKQTKY